MIEATCKYCKERVGLAMLDVVSLAYHHEPPEYLKPCEGSSLPAVEASDDYEGPDKPVRFGNIPGRRGKGTIAARIDRAARKEAKKREVKVVKKLAPDWHDKEEQDEWKHNW